MNSLESPIKEMLEGDLVSKGSAVVSLFEGLHKIYQKSQFYKEA